MFVPGKPLRCNVTLLFCYSLILIQCNTLILHICKLRRQLIIVNTAPDFQELSVRLGLDWSTARPIVRTMPLAVKNLL